MKTLRFFLIFPALVYHLGASAFADTEEGEPAELRQLRFGFQVELAELNKPLNKFNAKYRGYLNKQKTAYQEQGQLKAMLAVDGEVKTFEKEPAKELASFPELKRLQEIYREQRATLAEEASGPTLKLIGEYRKQAADLSVGWTREGKIEAAKAALVEAERFAAMEKDAVAAKKAGQTVALVPAMRMGSDIAGKAAGEEMNNNLGIALCWIPPGRFTMGSPEDELNRDASMEAQVEVELTRGFWMGKYEVTQEEYTKVMGTNPAQFKDAGKRAPVEKVSWDDAVAFCKALTERERERGKLPKGWAYRLPTEARWEYACRAGEKGPYSGGELDEVGWHRGNSGGKTHEVGGKKANAWGLHDMHGNVAEWGLDWMTNELAGGKDPTGPSSGSNCARRGGDWSNESRYCRAARRNGYKPSTQLNSIGFRVCLSSTSK